MLTFLPLECSVVRVEPTLVYLCRDEDDAVADGGVGVLNGIRGYSTRRNMLERVRSAAPGAAAPLQGLRTGRHPILLSE